MADNSCESQTFANVPDGFVKLLSFIVQVAMGPSVRPVFTLCQHRVNDSLTMHQAAVQFKGGRGELRRFRFVGRAMPTERHAMQMAAREAIARLRDVLPVMKTRRYRYLPCHVPYTCHYAYSCPRGERDEAFEMLIEYLRALEAAFDNLVDDFVATRMDSVHGCAANRRELLPRSATDFCLVISIFYAYSSPAFYRRIQPSHCAHSSAHCTTLRAHSCTCCSAPGNRSVRSAQHYTYGAH